MRSWDEMTCQLSTSWWHQIPYGTVKDAIRKQIASGKAHYQEEHLLEEMMTSASCRSIGEKAGIQAPGVEGMQVSDPTSIRHLVTHWGTSTRSWITSSRNSPTGSGSTIAGLHNENRY